MKSIDYSGGMYRFLYKACLRGLTFSGSFGIGRGLCGRTGSPERGVKSVTYLQVLPFLILLIVLVLTLNSLAMIDGESPRASLALMIHTLSIVSFRG